MTQAPTQVTAHQAPETHQRIKDGTELPVRTWLSAPDTGEPRGTVTLVHGVVEHNGRYPYVAKVFTDLDLRVKAFDLRDHGKSDGPRMALGAQDNHLTDLTEIVDAAVAEWHKMPFVLGHSMGGLIVARFTTAYIRPVHGALLSSPALQVELSPGTGIVHGLLSALAPKLAAPNPVNLAKFSHDPNIAATYRTDPLVRGTISAPLLEFVLNAITRAQQDAPRLETSMLLMTGDVDSIVDPSGSRDFYASAPRGLRTLAWFDDGYREAFNETEPLRNEVFRKMTGWLVSWIWFEVNWLHRNNENQ